MHSDAGTLLVEGSLITEAQLQQALTMAVQQGGTLIQSIIRLGYVTDIHVANYFASRLRLPMAEHTQLDNLPAFITRLVPNDIVISHRLVPIMLHKGILHIAMADPTDRAALEEIGFATGYTASPVVAPFGVVEEAMARYYGIPPDGRTEQPPPPEPPPPTEEAVKAEPIPTRISNLKPPVVESVPEPAKDEVSSRKTADLWSEADWPQSEAGLDQAKKHLEVVETKEEELEELFFLLGKEESVVHLTRRKGIDVAGTITDAVRHQTEANPETPSSPASGQPSVFAPSDGLMSTTDTAEFLESVLAKRHGGAPPPSGAIDEDDDHDSFVDIDIQPPRSAAADFGPPLEQHEALNKLRQVGDRDEVARILVRFALNFTPRIVLLIMRKESLEGWMAAGEGLSSQKVKSITIPMGSPSVFKTVRATETDYFGTLPRTLVNDSLVKSLGDVRPRQVLVIPILVSNKMICVFYGDCGSAAGFIRDLSPVYLVIPEVQKAFERIILKHKAGLNAIHS